MLLDGHFVDRARGARPQRGCFFNFNGTAGIWRRAAIEDAGGWRHDTLTEDLDLSYRAQLRRLALRLPARRRGARRAAGRDRRPRGQQRRWTRGSAQCLRLLGGAICRAPLPIAVKAEGLAHLGANLCYPLVVALTVLLLPAMWLRRDSGFGLAWLDVPLWLCATGSVAAFYLTAATRAGRSKREAAALLPLLMALGIGMSWHNARAALGGLVRRGGVFERTPKYDLRTAQERWIDKGYRARRAPRLAAEALLALYLCGVLAAAIVGGLWWSLPFLLLFLAGYSYVLGLAALSGYGRAPAVGRAEDLAALS